LMDMEGCVDRFFLLDVLRQSTVGHFAQVNPQGNELLKQLVLDLAIGKEICELYAGAGNLSLMLAQAGRRVEAVETDEQLVKFGEKQARALKLERHLTFFNLSAERFVKEHSLLPTVILDPPRGGAKEVVKYFRPGKVKNIVYVSCNLPTLCRDLKTLVEAGYSLERVLVLDMFPQTGHVEIIAGLN